MCSGASVIVSPFGEVLAGPACDRQELLVADLELGEVVRGKFDLDVSGHNAPPDSSNCWCSAGPRAPEQRRIGGESI